MVGIALRDQLDSVDTNVAGRAAAQEEQAPRVVAQLDAAQEPAHRPGADRKPPGSRQLMVPPAAVFEIAPAKVLQGAVRLHGFASSPTPETQVRVACAKAGAACRPSTIRSDPANPRMESFFIVVSRNNRATHRRTRDSSLSERPLQYESSALPTRRTLLFPSPDDQEHDACRN